MRPDRGLPRPGRPGDVKEPQRELTVGAGDGHDLIEWECHRWILFIMISASRACPSAASIGCDHLQALSHGNAVSFARKSVVKGQRVPDTEHHGCRTTIQK